MFKHESPKRSFAKTMTWRVVATITTISLVFIFTGEMVLALEVGIVEVVAKMLLYFVHERAWDMVSWGKVTKEEE